MKRRYDALSGRSNEFNYDVYNYEPNDSREEDIFRKIINYAHDLKKRLIILAETDGQTYDNLIEQGMSVLWKTDETGVYGALDMNRLFTWAATPLSDTYTRLAERKELDVIHPSAFMIYPLEKNMPWFGSVFEPTVWIWEGPRAKDETQRSFTKTDFSRGESSKLNLDDIHFTTTLRYEHDKSLPRVPPSFDLHALECLMDTLFKDKKEYVRSAVFELLSPGPPNERYVVPTDIPYFAQQMVQFIGSSCGWTFQLCQSVKRDYRKHRAEFMEKVSPACASDLKLLDVELFGRAPKDPLSSFWRSMDPQQECVDWASIGMPLLTEWIMIAYKKQLTTKILPLFIPVLTNIIVSYLR
jgi:hypothetical protein